MASARSRLGAARRSLIKRKKKTDVFSGILGTAGTLAAFAGTQAKKAKTAWGEYEAGYKAIGGDPTDIDKGGWFNRTFKGPKGDVRIGDTMYGREDIRKAGSFLGGDAGAILSDEQRSKYLERTVTGTAVSTEQLTSELRGRQEQAYKTFLSDPENVRKYGKDIYAQGAGIGDLDKSRQMLTDAGWTGGKTFTSGLTGQTGGVTGGVGIQWPDFRRDYKAIASGERGRDAAETIRLQELAKFTPTKAPSDYDIESQPYMQYPPSQITPGLQIPEQNLSIPALSSEEVGRKKAQEQQWRLDRIPSSTSYERSQEQFYKEDPYRERIDSPYNSPWKSWEEQ